MNTYTAKQREIMDDIMTAALEGGINYWCLKAQSKTLPFPNGAKFASQVPSNGGTLVLTTDDGQIAEIDADSLWNGIESVAKKHGMTIDVWFDNHDANSADDAVQMASFGELIYC